MSKVEALALNDKIHDFLQHAYNLLLEAPPKESEAASYSQFVSDGLLNRADDDPKLDSAI